MSTTLIRAALAAGGVLGVWHGAGAQSCSVPQMLVPDAAIQVNTCQSIYMPQSLCGGAVTGPAMVFKVHIDYPYTLAFDVTPGVGSAFDPIIVVNGSQCETGSCPRFADSAGPGGAEQLNLDLDSGSYNVIVTSFNPDPQAACGSAVIRERTLGDNNNNDGIFLQGFNY